MDVVILQLRADFEVVPLATDKEDQPVVQHEQDLLLRGKVNVVQSNISEPS
jgi:hypothetical protein